MEKLTLLDKRWLDLREASHYSGIGKNRLKILADDGVITGFSDPDNKRGDWIFDRLSIDVYQLNKSGAIEVKIRVQEILASVGRSA